jgi:hypothetical protein
MNKNLNNDSCACCTTCETLPVVETSDSSGCSCGPDCCETTNEPKIEKRQVEIDFLYLDLSICTRCQGADTVLDEALAEVSNVFAATGVEVHVNKVNVINEALALKHHFVSSPTIRINGRDIQLEVKETLCESCGDLCGDEVDCREWLYQGETYNVPPKAMIIEALLKAVYSNDQPLQESHDYVLPENLKRFYSSMEKKAE